MSALSGWFRCSLLSNRYMTSADRGHITQGQESTACWNWFGVGMSAFVSGSLSCSIISLKTTFRRYTVFVFDPPLEQWPLEIDIRCCWSLHDERAESNTKWIHTALQTTNGFNSPCNCLYLAIVFNCSQDSPTFFSTPFHFMLEFENLPLSYIVKRWIF